MTIFRVEWSVMEWSGVEWSGLGWSRVEWSSALSKGEVRWIGREVR